MWDNLLVEGFYDSPFLWVPINWSNIALIWSEADILRPRCQSEIGNLSSMSDVPWLSDETKLTVKNPCRHICRNFCSIGFTFQEGQKWMVDIRPAGSSLPAAPRRSMQEVWFATRTRPLSPADDICLPVPLAGYTERSNFKDTKLLNIVLGEFKREI